MNEKKRLNYIMSQENFIVPEKYKCSICYELFKLPRTTLEGNTYCKDCIVKWFLLRIQIPIPIKKWKINDFFLIFYLKMI